jgi:hypothetical protein
MVTKEDIKDPRFPAAVTLLGRTGADEFQIRFSPEDEPPITWTALGRWGKRWECAAAMDPLSAIFRLCDEVIDGGQCTHCKKPAGFESSMDEMPLNQFVCWYQWDPSTKEFKRGCA